MTTSRDQVGLDITRVLEGWDYDPNDVRVRIVSGEDGREKIQLRLDLGLLQMEIDGRPDGTRPEGFESLLDSYEQRATQRAAEQPDGAGLVLGREDCQKLLAEGVQYYHRYVSFWNLQRYELCARDTARNLRLFAFVRAHARHDRDKMQFDQWRPYVLMMHARAVATPLVEAGKVPLALEAIDAAIESIWAFLREYNQEERSDQCQELEQLKRWRSEVAGQHEQPKLPAPSDPRSVLQAQLASAIADERYEDAARLRDQLRNL